MSLKKLGMQLGHWRPLPIVIAMISILVTVTASVRALASDTKPTRLTAREIRSRVIGKVVTDGAHWSDYFERGGALVSWSIGHKHTGKWQIRGDELCITEEAEESPTCYQVWVSGEDISLRLEGLETTFTGYLKKHTGE